MNGEMRDKGLLGAVGLAALAASLCCVIPLLFAGAGVTALAVAGVFAGLRPYLLVVTGLLLAGGFYYAYRPLKASCEPGGACGTPVSRRRARIGLWVATAFALALITIPYWSAPFAQNLVQNPQPDSQPARGIAASVAPSPQGAVPEALAVQNEAALRTVQQTTFEVSGMFCAGCAAAMETYLERQAGVRAAQVNFSESSAEVEYDPSAISQSQIQGLIEKAGFQVVKVTSKAGSKG